MASLRLPPQLRRPAVQWGLMAAWFAVLSAALTWPMPTQPYEAALGSIHADGMKHLWTLWWMKASVWDHGQFPFHTDLINYPVGMDLYPIEPLNGLVAVLLPWMGVVGLSNLLVFLNMTATGLAGAWLGQELSGRRAGAFVAGTLLEGSAVMAFFVHVGVGELWHLWWLPLGLGCLLRARRTLAWGWFFALAACLVGSLLSCFYLGFFLAVSVAMWALLTLWAGWKTPPLLLRYALAAGLSLAIVLPVIKSFSTSYRSGDVPPVGIQSYLLEEHGQPITDPPSARVELRQLLTPGREPARREERAYGGGRYLGWLALGLALVGVVREPRKGLPWLVVGGVGVLMATGSYLTADGEAVLTDTGSRIRMPIFWLNRLLGYYAEPLNFPVRFLAVTVTAISALAALAVRRWPWLALLAPLAVLEVGWGQMLDWPWASFAPRDARALIPMQALEDRAIIDLALAVRSDQENRFSALGTQIRHGKQLNAIPLERIEFFARDGVYFVKATGIVQDLTPLYNNAGGSLDKDYRADFAVLRDAGFSWILVAYRNGSERLPTQLVVELDRTFGEAVVRDTGLGVWEIPAVEHTAAELETWKAQHAAAVEQLSRMDPGMGRPLR